MATIDITGLDRAALISALYNHARPTGLGHLVDGSGSSMDVETARALLNSAPTVTVRESPPAERPYTDTFGTLFVGYLRGRPLHIAVIGAELECDRYDSTYGAGAADRALALLSRTGERQ
ncbi:hypothetical protein OH787_06020 [Streptomyces sp. NBC_01547]|uniref:hypothetical protein n=1 Tax=Streptomyces sp. NBC_01547 TaxID=2975873 RepID=UPI0038650E6D